MRNAGLILVILVAFMRGCGQALNSPAPAPQGTPFFRPSTPAGTSTSAAGLPTAAEAAGPVPTVQCQDKLTFLEDLTIPDGTTVSPGSTLDKRWEVENSGECNWGPGYRVRVIAGPELSAQKEQALYPARSGTRAVIRILFKAPAEAGTYRSAWQALDEQGEAFGDPFFIEINVQ